MEGRAVASAYLADREVAARHSPPSKGSPWEFAAAGDDHTVHYEGLADEPTGAKLERLKELYFESFPHGFVFLQSDPPILLKLCHRLGINPVSAIHLTRDLAAIPKQVRTIVPDLHPHRVPTSGQVWALG